MRSRVKSAIICVDDEKMILDSLSLQLSKAFGDDFLYEFAESADEAFEVIEEFEEEGTPLVVVVSDWLMPRMKGDEFLVKLHERFPEVVKIMLSGQADPASVQNAKEHANLHQFVKKPWKEEELVAAIRSAFQA